MKANRVERKKKPKSVIAIAAVIVVAAAAVAAAIAYRQLHELWIEQCVVTDVSKQITVNDGVMVKGAAVLDAFGIRNGVNLALIDFDACRRQTLAKLPCIKNISITRLLPNRATISVVERRAVVKLGVHGKATATGRVADDEGVVFTCRRGTGMLPTIRERESEITPVGGQLRGRAMAALRMIEAASDAEYSALGVLDVDISKPDYLQATLGNYSRAKLAWDDMDSASEASRRQMLRRLDNLKAAFTSNVLPDAKVWNATEPNRVYADTQEPLL